MYDIDVVMWMEMLYKEMVVGDVLEAGRRRSIA